MRYNVTRKLNKTIDFLVKIWYNLLMMIWNVQCKSKPDNGGEVMSMTNDCELKCGGFNHFVNERFDQFADLHEHTITQVQTQITHKISIRVALRELLKWIAARSQADPDYQSDRAILLGWFGEWVTKYLTTKEA
jgi:hypothetical protein